MHESTKGRAPGQWWPCAHGTPVTIYCPNCGKPHGITPPPEVGHFECTVCGHHDEVELVGWPDAPTADQVAAWNARSAKARADLTENADYLAG